MRLRDWLRGITGVGPAPAPMPPRHERREAARERAHEGGEGWTDADRHENKDGTRMVQDVVPGTPGAGGSRLGH
jgi:hypothetical protein